MFWNRFVDLCNEAGKSPNAVAAACGVKSSGTVTGWSRGATPRKPVLHKMAEYFHVSVDYLTGNVNNPFYHLDDDRILQEINSYVDEDESKKNAPLPSSEAMKLAREYDLLDHWGRRALRELAATEQARLKEFKEQQKRTKMEAASEISEVIISTIPFRRSFQPASAGTGIYLGPDEFETIYVQNNPITRRASFGVPVEGDSMEPKYHDGDLLLVEKANAIDIGEIGIFTLDGNGYVKKLGKDMLISLNPVYDPIPMTEDIRCNGRVIGIMDPDWVVAQ